MTPTVALVHATLASMSPAHSAFAERFPTARLWNLLDDRLLPDAAAAGGLTPPLRRRMRTLVRHAVDAGADAVLLACSLYGPVAIEEAAGCPVPLLASDQALFDAVRTETARGARRISVLGPNRASVDDTTARLRGWLADPEVRITGLVVAHERPVAAGIAADADVVVLGQFSLSPARPAVQTAVSVPVLSPPHLAADLLRSRLAGSATE